jgi:galactose-1-phosphate uridylyltransferase
LDCTEATVSRILNDPLGLAFIEQAYKELEGQLRAQFGQVVTVMKKALESDNMDVALSAADKWFKVHGKYRDKEDKVTPNSAEDIIQKMLRVASEKGMVKLEVSTNKTDEERPDGFHKVIEGDFDETAG